MEQLSVFNNLIFKTRWDLNWNDLENTCKELISCSPGHNNLEYGNGKSSVNAPRMPHTEKSFSGLNDVFTQILPEICWNNWNLRPGKLGCTKSWVNVHPPGAWTEEHDHSASNLAAAVAVYLKVPKNSGNILFRDPLEYHWKSMPFLTNNSDYIWKGIEVSQGDVLIFPPWLIHKTEINKSDDERWVASFNIYVE